MSASLGELDILRTLAADLDAAKHGQRTPLVDRAAALLRCGRQEVYRRLKQRVGWTSGRKRRKDRGQISVDEATAVKMAHLVAKATRANGKRTMPMTVALELLRESGEGKVNWETGEVTLPKSASTMSRAMRRFGCHPTMLAQGKPHIHMKSLHPNHVWQIDASLCVLFYLPKGQVRIMDERQYYKNKPQYLERAAKERVWRYVITDHYSGNLYVHYAQAKGENSEDLIECFLRAISKRELDDPMHGVPFILILDKGSANSSALFCNLLDRLGVRYIPHEVGNSRAKGQVEQGQNLVETQFESRLSFHRVTNLEELRELADKWRTSYCAYKLHTRHGHCRNDMWLRITEAQLRLAPPMELCRDLVTTHPVETRVKPDHSITHKVKGYGRNIYDLRLLPGIVPGLKVKVVVNPYRVPAVDVILIDPNGDESVWTVEPVQTDEAGFWESAAVWGEEHKAHKDTVADKHVKAIDAAAGTDKSKMQPPENVNVWSDIRPAPEYLPRRGRDLGLDASHRELAPLTITEAAMALKARLGAAWTGEAYAWLSQRYGESVPAADLDSIAARLSVPDKPAIQPLRVVGGEGAS